MSNAETRDSPSRDGVTPTATMDERNKEASSVPQTVVTSPVGGLENENNKELLSAGNEM